jgi:hypothetical protein
VNAGINETIFTFAGPPPLEVLLPAFGREDQHAKVSFLVFVGSIFKLN